MIGMAHELGSPLVRIMTSKKEQILWGLHGAEHWNVAKGAWDTLPPLIAPAVDLARAEGVRLVVETGNGTMVNSNYTARKLIDELDAKDTLQVLWDPANNCWCHENAFPEGYDEIRDGYLGHLHIKDVNVDTPRHSGGAGDGQRTVGRSVCSDGSGATRGQLRGVIFESVYHPGNNSFEDGFRSV